MARVEAVLRATSYRQIIHELLWPIRWSHTNYFRVKNWGKCSKDTSFPEDERQHYHRAVVLDDGIFILCRSPVTERGGGGWGWRDTVALLPPSTVASASWVRKIAYQKWRETIIHGGSSCEWKTWKIRVPNNVGTLHRPCTDPAPTLDVLCFRLLPTTHRWKTETGMEGDGASTLLLPCSLIQHTFKLPKGILTWTELVLQVRTVLQGEPGASQF